MPSLNRYTLWTLILAGALATVAFDAVGLCVSPLLGFPTLETVKLPGSVVETLTGAAHPPVAYLVHLLTGLVAFPVGWLFIARPLATRLAPGLPWPVVAMIYGGALWVFALFAMAHLVVGLPAFLGFAGVAWVALAAHVVFALILAAVVRWRHPR